MCQSWPLWFTARPLISRRHQPLLASLFLGAPLAGFAALGLDGLGSVSVLFAAASGLALACRAGLAGLASLFPSLFPSLPPGFSLLASAAAAGFVEARRDFFPRCFEAACCAASSAATAAMSAAPVRVGPV